MTTTATRDRIAALRAKAAKAGDAEQVALCDTALSEKDYFVVADARVECLTLIARAERESNGVATHYFDSTGEAYDESQTEDYIKDGDVLVVESERVVGFLLKAWPTALTSAHGAFEWVPEESKQGFGEKYGRRYAASLDMARRIILERGWSE
jgi:hypothetical protein